MCCVKREGGLKKAQEEESRGGRSVQVKCCGSKERCSTIQVKSEPVCIMTKDLLEPCPACKWPHAGELVVNPHCYMFLHS